MARMISIQISNGIVIKKNWRTTRNIDKFSTEYDIGSSNCFVNYRVDKSGKWEAVLFGAVSADVNVQTGKLNVKWRVILRGSKRACNKHCEGQAGLWSNYLNCPILIQSNVTVSKVKTSVAVDEFDPDLELLAQLTLLIQT
jgi:hypothetical protein